MKATKSIIVIATTLSIGLAGSLSAEPRSKQIGTPTSPQREANSISPASSVDHSHIQAGPKSKQIGG